jgi:hypothetical protein
LACNHYNITSLEEDKRKEKFDLNLLVDLGWLVFFAICSFLGILSGIVSNVVFYWQLEIKISAQPPIDVSRNFPPHMSG